MKKRFHILTAALCLVALAKAHAPRVFVFTDINIDAGDPDDRQSLVHLLWYANELTIEGIVPDRWNAHGADACSLAIDAYDRDYTVYGFAARGYPSAVQIRARVATNIDDALQRFDEAAKQRDSPLYVLIWGNMTNLAKALIATAPENLPHLRIITIGTGLMRETDLPHLPDDWKNHGPCLQPNWNGAGRDLVYQNPRFYDLWWLEINWTYNGMFPGPEPKKIFDELSRFGQLGQHLVDVTENHPWARYFRVGDTPSVLYLIDPYNNYDDPTSGSWAGSFAHPFPQSRPNYYTDDAGPHKWNYAHPCSTWQNAERVAAYAQSTLLERRSKMYRALLLKLESLYSSPNR